MIAARDVTLEGIDVANTSALLHIGATGASIRNGKLGSAAQAAILVRGPGVSRSATLELRSISFKRPKKFILDGLDSASFIDCDFSDCNTVLGGELLNNPRVTVTNCRFDRSCKA
jgi:hypothetical protein